MFRFPTKYELMIANPPWITASMLNSEHALDNGVYDPKEEFLNAIFKFAGKNEIFMDFLIINFSQTSLGTKYNGKEWNFATLL